MSFSLGLREQAAGSSRNGVTAVLRFTRLQFLMSVYLYRGL